MPPTKRKSSDERGGGGGGAKRPALQCTSNKQHLYLLLDDWERGYSVRRLDIDAFEPDDLPPPERFTEPPVARIEAEAAEYESERNFVSHGTKIFAMQPGEASPAIPAFDASTLALSLCPWPFSYRQYPLPFFASAAGKLLAFTEFDAAYLGDQPPCGSKAPWSWTAIKARSPFYASQVRCYALHPDGRTLFVSAASLRSHRSGTFSLDTERLEWRRHGDWLLPFSGQAYFDAELEAWVGLCGEMGSPGHLCSCDVAPVAAEFTRPPSWKIGKEKLFRKNPELHLGAKLVYMGRSKFCLVEFLFQKDDDDHPRSDQPRRRVLDMTTFGLKYSKEGKLQTTLQRSRACKMYKRPQLRGIADTIGILALNVSKHDDAKQVSNIQPQR